MSLPSAPKRCELPADPAALKSLKEWHRGSLILDANEEPLVVYHGTYVHSDETGNDLVGNIQSFDRNITRTVVKRAASFDTVGSWFSSNPGAGGAQLYGNTIYPVYLRILRPKHYDSFKEFQADFNEANGSGNPLASRGDADPLREKLKAQGYDGICLAQTNTTELMQELADWDRAIRSATDEAWSAPKGERSMYLSKVNRLKESRAAVYAEIEDRGSSRELDFQMVMIAFDPEQVKSAIGCDHNFSRESAFITGLSPDEQDAKSMKFCNQGRGQNIALAGDKIAQHFSCMGSLETGLNHYAELLSQTSEFTHWQARQWLDGCFSGGSLEPFHDLAEMLLQHSQVERNSMNPVITSEVTSSFGIRELQQVNEDPPEPMQNSTDECGISR